MEHGPKQQIEPFAQVALQQRNAPEAQGKGLQGARGQAPERLGALGPGAQSRIRLTH